MLASTTRAVLVGHDVRLGHADRAARAWFRARPGGRRPPTARWRARRRHAGECARAMGSLAAQRRGQHKANLALLHNVGGAVALAGFRPGVSHQRHAKGGAIKVRRLPRVSHVELNVVGALKRKKIAVRCEWLSNGLRHGLRRGLNVGNALISSTLALCAGAERRVKSGSSPASDSIGLATNTAENGDSTENATLKPNRR